MTLPTTIFQYTDGVRDVSRISPDNWVHDQALLDRPGNKDIQLDLFYDYRTNVPLYPQFQAFLPRAQAADADRLGQERQDLPRGRGAPLPAGPAERGVAHLDTGHFALEDKLDEMAPLIRGFLDKQVAKR